MSWSRGDRGTLRRGRGGGRAGLQHTRGGHPPGNAQLVARLPAPGAPHPLEPAVLPLKPFAWKEQECLFSTSSLGLLLQRLEHPARPGDEGFALRITSQRWLQPLSLSSCFLVLTLFAPEANIMIIFSTKHCLAFLKCFKAPGQEGAQHPAPLDPARSESQEAGTGTGPAPSLAACRRVQHCPAAAGSSAAERVGHRCSPKDSKRSCSKLSEHESQLKTAI